MSLFLPLLSAVIFGVSNLSLTGSDQTATSLRTHTFMRLNIYFVLL